MRIPKIESIAILIVYACSCTNPTKQTNLSKPESDKFVYTVLATGLDEPLQMAILKNNDVLFISRRGSVNLYKATEDRVIVAGNFNVFSGIEDGLLGVAPDPEYEMNHWIYFYYSVAGEKWVNRLSRFEMLNDRLIMESEKVLLDIPTQRKYCCHSAGYIAFGADGLLYLSTGDNTSASPASREGYPPIDERKGEALADAQATAANSRDLRGKILRIKPEAAGGYSIPSGNLFSKDGSQGRPEIYVMGCRNPYRISVDQKNNYVYWGEVGPNTIVRGRDSTNANYDEINQARKPGFFGWPYFIGNNDAFPDYNYATKVVGPHFDPLNPVNDSPNNSGLQLLPPAQPAMIWYGLDSSRYFPIPGKGTACAMAGPVYYSDLYKDAKYKLPDYYNGKLFIYDWIRRWVMAVTLDDAGNYQRMEPFLDHLPLTAPIDMQIGPDGAIYFLEYGSNWFARNVDARLIRVEYAEGNRPPIPVIDADPLYGSAPLTVQFSGERSLDYDTADQITSIWNIAGNLIEGAKVEHTFKEPGEYDVQLTVTDQHEEASTATIKIRVGNTPPKVEINTNANRTFYWDNTMLQYSVRVSDPEDTVIDSDRLRIFFQYLPNAEDVGVVLSDSMGFTGIHSFGKRLTMKMDCRTCHSVNDSSIGPSYQRIAWRYQSKEDAARLLAKKVMQGGSGVWGDYAMSPHPDLSESDALEMVKYILSLSGESMKSLAAEGSVPYNEHNGHAGAYLLLADYIDRGANGISPLRTRDYVVLRDPQLKMERFDEGTANVSSITNVSFVNFIGRLYNNGFVKFNQIDLSGVKGLRYRVQASGEGGTLELRLGAAEGRLISTLEIPAGRVTDFANDWKELNTVLMPVEGIHDLYFVFKNPNAGKKNLFNLDWVYFSNKAAPAELRTDQPLK